MRRAFVFSEREGRRLGLVQSALLARMPVAARLLIALGVGTGCGIAGGGVGAGFALAAAAGLALAGGRLEAAVLVLGLGHGLWARARDRAGCAARLPAGIIQVEVRLEEPVRSELAVIRISGCGAGIDARWPEEAHWNAGDLLRATGRWIPRPESLRPGGGLFFVRAAERVGSAPSVGDRLRNRLGGTSDRLYGARAGMVDALVLGRRGGIDQSLNTAFARSGLVHLLSISGFHVGLLAGWLLLLARSLRLGRSGSLLAATAGATGYVLFIGAPPPALRAAALGIVASVEAVRQRQIQSGSLLAVTALVVVLADPWSVFDVGAWLSVLALWGAAAGTRWSDHALGSRAIWRLLASSVGATAATAPVTAWMFGSIAPIGILLNLIAIPLAALAVPAVVASLVVAPIAASAAAALAAGGGALLSLLERVAQLGAEVPGGAITLDPGWTAGALGLVSAALCVWAFGRRNTGRESARRCGWAAGLTLIALAVPPTGWSPDTGTRLTLHFLNVGQGDAALIRTPHGRWILIDAGPVQRGQDAGQRVIVPFLRSHGVGRLAAFVLSHAHADHYGGARSVLERVPADVVLEPGVAAPDSNYLGWLDAIDRLGERWRTLRAGEHFAVDGVAFDALHPDAQWAGWGDDLNENSVVLRLRYGLFEALFAGDIGAPAETRVAGQVGPIDLLKVGHHGSAGSSTAGFLAELHSKAAVVSVGVNHYGHPSPAAMQRLAEARVDVWRTDREGTIRVTVDETVMRVEGRRGAREYLIGNYRE